MTDSASGGMAASRPTEATAAPNNGSEVASSDQPESPIESGSDAERAAANKRRRRGSRGGRNRSRSTTAGAPDSDRDSDDTDSEDPDSGDSDSDGGFDAPFEADTSNQPELPDRPIEGRIQSVEIAAQALVPRRPQIGDSRPARPAAPVEGDDPAVAKKPRRSGRQKAATSRKPDEKPDVVRRETATRESTKPGRSRTPVKAILSSEPVEVDEETMERRRGKERKGRPVGRYMMCVHVSDHHTQIAVLEGRSLMEHYVSRSSDDVAQIHGNVYLGRVQNVLPGMEAAFVDIGTPKNAVLYRGDVQYDAEDIVEGGESGERGRGKKASDKLRIEQMLRPRQMIVSQVTKNPIGAKGARLTQEVSLPGRFVVLIPNSKTYGISKRLPDDERKRLRAILDKVKPAEHGVIVRTAAENVVEEELRADVERLLSQWSQIDELARRTQTPALLYREPDMAVRVIREEFNSDYRGVVIDDRAMFEEVKAYVGAISPTLADRVEYYDPEVEGLALFERHHVHEQLHKALDRKVWLPSGGSLIIEHTEALSVIDVNTGKNVGTSTLEETVFHNNLEAAEEIARQLRLRDIGGIIVIDFIDMEIKENRRKVVDAFRDALSRDKTRTQVFDITELGLVEMTRKRIGEGLLTSFADPCPMCNARGVIVDHALIE